MHTCNSNQKPLPSHNQPSTDYSLAQQQLCKEKMYPQINARHTIIHKLIKLYQHSAEQGCSQVAK